jgi:arginine deiminase
MKSTRILAIIVAAALPSAVLLAQDEHGKMRDMMKEHPANMSEMHQKMEAEMKAQDAELDKLVSEMNTATGDKKADAMAAVLSKIVEQRKTMHEKMAGMQMDMKGAMDCCKVGMKK